MIYDNEKKKKSKAMVSSEPTDAAAHLLLSLSVLQIHRGLLSSQAGCGAGCSGVFMAIKHCYLHHLTFLYKNLIPCFSKPRETFNITHHLSLKQIKRSFVNNEDSVHFIASNIVIPCFRTHME